LAARAPCCAPGFLQNSRSRLRFSASRRLGIPAGKVGWHEGTILAGADSLDITVRGYGGHGAAPQASKDPIVLASEIVVALQTVVSREMDPQVRP